jgi:NAD(P)-dependent dehydrogenase (short-subunit alcohol dehydrogenase family)
VIVRAFARQNAKVVIADLNLDRAQEIAKGIEESDVLACLLDTTSEDSIKNAVDFAIKGYGTIDVLVNVAGLLCRKPFFETTKQDFEESFSVNVKGMFLVSREVSEIMRDNRSGSIINISSINGNLAVENRVVYGVTKSAVNILAKSMALKLAPFGISVNAVAPGVVDSKMARVRLNTPELRK